MKFNALPLCTLADQLLSTSSQVVNLSNASALIAIPVLVVLVAFLTAWIDVRKKTRRPAVTYTPTRFNDGVISRMPVLKEVYKPLMFTTNGHVETIFATKFRRKCDITYRRENVVMPDNGLVALDWRLPEPGDQPLPEDAPVVILFPGLTGGSSDSYVRYGVQYAEQYGIRAVVFNARGCGDCFLTTPQFYSAAWIEDTKRVIAHVQKLYPSSLLFATGWSIGANILTNYLGIVGEDTPLTAGTALCNPFDLTTGDENLKKGFNRVYDANLGRAMSKIMQRNQKVWNGAGPEFNLELALNSKTVRDWDDAITRVSFGYPSVDAYYADAGSYQRVHNVKIPLLVIQAGDDPISPLSATPQAALLENPNCILAVTPTGGHLGWVAGSGGYFGEPWTDRVIVEWMMSVQIQGAAPPDHPPSSLNSFTGGNLVRDKSPDPEWAKRQAASEAQSSNNLPDDVQSNRGNNGIGSDRDEEEDDDDDDQDGNGLVGMGPGMQRDVEVSRQWEVQVQKYSEQRKLLADAAQSDCTHVSTTRMSHLSMRRVMTGPGSSAESAMRQTPGSGTTGSVRIAFQERLDNAIATMSSNSRSPATPGTAMSQSMQGGGYGTPGMWWGTDGEGGYPSPA